MRISGSPNPRPIDDVMTTEEILRECLLERCFWTGDSKQFDRQGYTFETDDNTAIRDINYRDCPLYPTREEALEGHIKLHYPTA